MTPLKFEELANFICRFGQKIVGRYSKTECQLSLDGKWADRLRDDYETAIKPDIKNRTRDGSYSRLDRHKVAAALMLSIIKSQPLCAPADKAIPHRVREANISFAIEIGCMVVFLFGLTEAKQTKNLALAKIYAEGMGDFASLPTGNGDGEYIDQLVKAVRDAQDRNGLFFSEFLVSHIFFLIQLFFEQNRCRKLNIDPADIDLKARGEAIDALLALRD